MPTRTASSGSVVFSSENNIRSPDRIIRQPASFDFNSNRSFEMFSDFGIEIENSSTWPNFRLPKEFHFTHDASIQTPAKNISKSGVIVHQPKNKNFIHTTNATIGVEVASRVPLPVNNKESYIKIKEVLDLIYSNGGSFVDDRSGIHVHISVPKSLELIKSLLILALHTEDLFYYIGGMGQEFRGVKNDSIYCRPITKKGPPCVRSKSKSSYAQIFNVNDLLECETLRQFENRYGNISSTGYSNYPPARYSWINFVTIFRQGSVEYRVFNTTMSISLLRAVVRFCAEFTKLAMLKSLGQNLGIDFQENSIFDMRSKDDIIETFLEITERMDLPAQDIHTIIQAIINTPEIELKNEYVFSHLMFSARYGDRTSPNGYWRGNDYEPSKITEKIKKPTFVDIHSLTRGEV